LKEDAMNRNLVKFALRAATAASLAIVTTAAVGAARADDAKSLRDTDSKGWGDTVGRIGISYTTITGSEPIANAPSADYSQRLISIDMDLMGFWDATRFDTLIGAEWLVRFGQQTAQKYTGSDTQGDPSFFFRSDFAFDYGVVHWDGDLRGRISFGAGAGMDFAPRWYTTSGRFYPLVMLRAQFWIEDIGIHIAYHHIPTAAVDEAKGGATQREHRIEIGAGTGPIHGGVRLVLTKMLGAMSDGSDASEKQLGAFVMWAF
jgi:hypothetical protein